MYNKHHEDLILTNEGANSLDDCRNIIDMLEPRHRLDCGTWGVMGCGTGYAIGAALSTGKKVLYIGGDSAFGFDGMEVEVACRYQLPSPSWCSTTAVSTAATSKTLERTVIRRR